MPRLPRPDRAPIFSRTDDETVEGVAAQPPAVGMGDMGDPALDAGVQLGEADFAGMIGGKPRPQHRDAACRDVAVVGVAIVFGRKLRVELGGQLMFDRN